LSRDFLPIEFLLSDYFVKAKAVLLAQQQDKHIFSILEKTGLVFDQ
jgi:hypothetical protein